MKRFRGPFVGGSVCVLLTLGAAVEASAQTELRWKFKKSDVLHMAFHQKTDVKVRASAKDYRHTSELDVDFTWEVKAVRRDGVADVSQTVQRVRAKTHSPADEFDYDSKEKTGSPSATGRAMSQLYDSIVETSYDLVVDARGQILSVAIPEAIVEIVKDSPADATADTGSFFSPLGVQNMMAQVIPFTPQGPIAVGGRWKTTLDLPVGPFRMKLANHYVLAAFAPQSARIDARVETTFAPPPGAPLEVNLTKQTGRGTYAFNPAAGRLVGSSMVQRLELRLKSSQQQVERTIETTSSLTVR